ncbi:MAG: GDP-mannose 4,6-dehydratase, partial [Candidatus Neomarinimicrobiota bacterium]|nr:GDP-mannose 4,6-dehydratase [Candidatus Neomarinimicrobiota bacterium]
ATGETHSVREFIERSFAVLGESLSWEGSGEKEVGILESTGKSVVKIDPCYYRPTEVDLLIGDASKAERELGWMPKTTFKDLVQIMVEADYKKIKKRIK